MDNLPRLVPELCKPVTVYIGENGNRDTEWICSVRRFG
jgi:hypothetical protein